MCPMRDVLTSAHNTVESDLAAYHQAVAQSPVVSTSYEPDTIVYWSATEDASANVLVNATIPPDDARQRAAALTEPFFERGRAFRWITTPRTTSPVLESALAQLGLTPRTGSGMLAGLSREIDPETPRHTFIEVAWPDQLPALADTLADALPVAALDRETHLRYLDSLEAEECEVLVARDMGTSAPLGAVMIYRRKHSMIVPLLSLQPEGVRRKVGHALIATAINRAREAGARSVTTVAEKQEYELFAGLGFRTQFEVVAWEWHPTA